MTIDLLRRAKGTLGYSEVATLLVRQRKRLDWPYLLNKANSARKMACTLRKAKDVGFSNHWQREYNCQTKTLTESPRGGNGDA